jgi:hypothetical protein
LDEEMVEAAGGGLTGMGAPHPDKVVVALVPLVAVEVTVSGRELPTEMVRRFDSRGIELVAATLQVRTYCVAPSETSLDSVVPLDLGRSSVTDVIVRSDFRFAYWLEPAFQATQRRPAVDAWAEVRPKSVVSPAALPLTYPSVGVTLTARRAVPTEIVSCPLVRPTSAAIVSVFAVELERAVNDTWTPSWAPIAVRVARSTEPGVATAAEAPVPRATHDTTTIVTSASERRGRRMDPTPAMGW